MWKNHRAGPPPAGFFAIFKWIYLFISIVFITGSLPNLLSGLFIRRRINRTFSLVVAGLDCLQVPFGTVLGIFTLIVLLRGTVRERYAANAE